jgi:hypothetical protein
MAISSMGIPLEPSKPLKILTIDGGGLQAISSLLILDDLLKTIAVSNGIPHRKPRPCDVFDTIAGIGAGGWLALLLGRFRMDITACLSEWYKIMECIAPKGKTEEMKMRVLQHSYFDPDRLVQQIERLIKIYGTGPYMYPKNSDGVRTRHVFVAALRSDDKGYNLFRTYPIPESATLPKKLLEGPLTPETFNITRAFGVTGAARYFTPPWKEQMASGGKMRFSDTKFPKPHNITELALDEMWGLYGTDVPLSVVVNIGPGRPSTLDLKLIARRFSWGRSSPQRSPTLAPTQRTNRVQDKSSRFSEPEIQQRSEGHAVKFQENMPSRQSESGLPPTLPRIDTFGSIKDRKFEQKLKRLETDIERDIKMKLANLYPQGAELYYRFALDQAPPGTAQNDSSDSGAAMDATVTYLSYIESDMGEIAQRIRVNSLPSTGVEC